ncbi:cation/hydrogen exchanger 15 [Actinidia rufa]|uniref:Cation/hydrogen exchanger 15 n=1 Tax=Actinidia rufa TaxID=165716 RepID=A0A7J0DGZ2_9ERIC|nr:cation/hydrogen exchanger 15 [Actinidia rufa]
MMTAPGLLANETVCYSANMITGNGVFGTEDPLSYSLPLFLFQFILIVLTTRLVTILLKPLNQSRVFCELLAGIILGPSVMGRWYRMDSDVFPKFSIPLLETVANIGILYFVFMIGLGMEFSVIRKNGKKALAIASVGIFLPFIIGCAFSFFLHNITVPVREDTFTIFFSVALSVTALPVVMHMLAELRLLDMEIGKIAMSVALINDAVGLTLLIFGTSLAESQTPLISSLWIILTSIVFIIFCVLAVRPAIVWLARKNNPDEESLSTFTVPVILAGVYDFGCHNRCHWSASHLWSFCFRPCFSKRASSSHPRPTWVTLILAIVLSFVGKVAGTVLVALFFKMPFHEGIALGLLMNSKGLVELIGLGLNHGTDHKPMVDGGMEAANSKIRMLNQNVLANAPCSVGILVDRGLTESKILEASHVSHNIAVLFFGGPDDREALSYGLRMSKNPGITLNVIRFLPGPEAEENAITMDPSTHDDRNEHGILTMEMVKEIEKQLDDDYIKRVSAIKSLDNIHDLYIVGRGKGILVSPLTAGLTEWSECPELGVIGDLLASDFVATVSVLVVQQYMGVVPHDEVIGTPNHVFSQQQQQQDHCIIKLSQTLRD